MCLRHLCLACMQSPKPKVRARHLAMAARMPSTPAADVIAAWIEAGGEDGEEEQEQEEEEEESY